MDLFSLAYLVIPQGFVLSGAALRGSQLSILLVTSLMAASMIKDRAYFWFAVYFVIQCAAVMFMAVAGAASPNIVIKASSLLVYFLAGSVYLVYIIQLKTSRNKIYNVICIGALIQVFIAGSQFLTKEHGIIPKLFDQDFSQFMWSWSLSLVKNIEVDDLSGTMLNSNFCSAYLAMSVPFFFRKSWSWCLPFVLAVVLVSKTTTSVIALACGLSIAYWNGYLAFLLVAGAMLYGYLFDFNPEQIVQEQRFKADIPETIKQIFETPLTVLLGHGPGVKWQGIYPIHCEPLALWLRSGLIGLSLCAAFIIKLFLNSEKELRAALVIAVVCMFGTYSMTVAPTAILSLTIAGLIIRG